MTCQLITWGCWSNPKIQRPIPFFVVVVVVPLPKTLFAFFTLIWFNKIPPCKRSDFFMLLLGIEPVHDSSSLHSSTKVCSQQTKACFPPLLSGQQALQSCGYQMNELNVLLSCENMLNTTQNLKCDHLLWCSRLVTGNSVTSMCFQGDHCQWPTCFWCRIPLL